LIIPAVKVSSWPVQLWLLVSLPPSLSSELLQQLSKAAERVAADKRNREARIGLSGTVTGASGRPQPQAPAPEQIWRTPPSVTGESAEAAKLL